MKRGLLLFLICTTLSFGNNEVTCALSEIKAKSGLSESEASLIADRLRLEMYNTGKVTMVEREQMKSILAEQGFQKSGACDDDGCLVEIGQLLGVKYIIAGSMGNLGSLMMVNLRVIDVETGSISKVVNRDIKGGIEEVVKDLPDIAAALVPGEESPVIKEKSVEEKSKPVKKKNIVSNKENGIRLQIVSGFLLGSSRVVPHGFGGGATIGLQKNRHIVRLMGEFYFPDSFLSGGGLSYGYDLIRSELMVLAPTLMGGLWYGDALPGEGFDSAAAYECFEFGGISLLYEIGEGPVRFFLEPVIRLGSADDDRLEETKTTLQTRFLGTAGISIFFRGNR